MPFRSDNPIVRVETGAMHTIDTSNVENLFGLWSVFSKCAGTMEEGKRLENMSWRLWNREVFCCAPDQSKSARSQRLSLSRQGTSDSLPASVPELSSSVESEQSIPEEHAATCPARSARPELHKFDSSTEGRCCRKEKHITPIDLQDLVISIKEKKELEPLAPLPLAMQPEAEVQTPARVEDTKDTTPRPSSSPLDTIFESSTSTVATVVESELSNMSPPVGSDTSASTDLSAHSVVRGFSLGRASSSFRSNTQLAPPPSILKNSPHKIELRRMEPRKPDLQKKKGAMFQLGTSSDEDAAYSSVEASSLRHSALTDAFKRPPLARKRASFKLGDDLATTQSDDEDSEAIDTDDEPSESAIEEDDDEEWSDEEDESDPSSVTEFQRVDSRPQLSSRRSLITTQLHEQDRVKALQNEASRSSPAIRRSRTSSPNGPSLAASPKETSTHLEPRGMQIPSKPIIMTTSNTHPPALSPRTTRRNMLSTELTESLRKHLLWERQQKNATSNAALKRRHTSNDVKNLKQYPEVHGRTLEPIRENGKNNNSWGNAFYENGLQEYHTKGW